MNILKIIKKAPKDHVYYCTLVGEVTVEINDKSFYPIKCINLLRLSSSSVSCTEEGYYYKNEDGECVLFPSKDQRDWAEFERTLEETTTFKPFDKVLCRDYGNEVWKPDLFGFIKGDGSYKYHCLSGNYMQCIPYEGNEDKLGKV